MSRLQSYRAEIRPTLALALPIIVGQVSQMLMGVTDSLMIGRLGAVPLAASSFGGHVFGIFYVLGIGLMVPVSILVSRARGAGELREAGEFLRHGVVLAAAFGAAEMLAMAAVGTQFHRFGQPPEVLAIVTPFALWLAASIPPVLAYLALRQFAEAMGHPWAPMVIMLGSVGLNAGLNWILIYGNLGVSAYGLAGAGCATFLSRLAALVVIALWLRRDPKVRAAWPQRWLGGYEPARWREMLRIGVPAAGMLLFESSAFALSGIMVGWLGAVPLAAHQIAISCASLAFMFPLGLSIAVGMRVSHAVGAGERARLQPIAFGAMGLGFGVMGAFALGFWLAGRQIAGWFVTDAAVIALAVQLLAVAALFQLVDGVQVIAASALRGVSDNKVPVTITLVAYWLVALPLGYGLGIAGPLGAVGIWIGIAGGLTFAAIFLSVRYARRTAL